MTVLFDMGAFTHPAGGRRALSGSAPSTPLFVAGMARALAFGIAALAGYKVARGYGEEAKARPALVGATFAALAFLASCRFPKEILQKRRGSSARQQHRYIHFNSCGGCFDSEN
jgi:hypothetical protein